MVEFFGTASRRLLATLVSRLKKKIVTLVSDTNPMAVQLALGIDSADDAILQHVELFSGNLSESSSFSEDSVKFQRSNETRTIRAFKAESGVVAPESGLVFFEKRVFPESGNAWNPQPQQAALLQLPTLLAKYPPRTVDWESVFSIGPTKAFYHFLAEQLPRVLALSQVDPNLVVLVGDQPAEFAKGALEAANVKWMRSDFPLVSPRSVWLVEHSRPAEPLREELVLVRDFYLSKLPEKLGEQFAPRKIYVSRRMDSRGPKWEDDLVFLLQDLGFTIYDGNHSRSWLQQVGFFSQAAVVLGFQGAGLMNSIFAPRGTLLVEIFRAEGFGPGLATFLPEIGLDHRKVNAIDCSSPEMLLKLLPAETFV